MVTMPFFYFAMTIFQSVRTDNLKNDPALQLGAESVQYAPLSKQRTYLRAIGGMGTVKGKYHCILQALPKSLGGSNFHPQRPGGFITTSPTL